MPLVVLGVCRLGNLVNRDGLDAVAVAAVARHAQLELRLAACERLGIRRVVHRLRSTESKRTTVDISPHKLMVQMCVAV